MAVSHQMNDSNRNLDFEREIRELARKFHRDIALVYNGMQGEGIVYGVAHPCHNKETGKHNMSLLLRLGSREFLRIERNLSGLLDRIPVDGNESNSA
jgi:hypothetical protein